MSYLFDKLVPKDYWKGLLAAENRSMAGAFEQLEKKCVQVTATLLAAHPRNHTTTLDAAQQLVGQMGGKSRKGTGIPHASDYVSEWRMVSGNHERITGLVYGQLERAYQLGLDISDSVVIGNLFDLATQIWSGIGDYTGFDQDEGRR